MADPWDGAVTSFLGIAATTSGAFTEASVAFAPCTKPPATCYGDAQSATVYCRADMLVRLTKSAAWLAASYESEGKSNYDEVAGDDRSGPAADSFRYGWGVVGSPAIAKRAEELRSTTLPELLRPQHPEAGVDLYAAIGGILFQFVVGHESTHANGEVCAPTTRATVEESGLFDKAVTLDSGSALFCANALDRGELNADRCALRQLRLFGDKVDTRFVTRQSLAQLSRRGAAALLSWYAFAGYIEQPTAPRVTSLIQDGYLRGPLRGLLIAAELSRGLSGPAARGESARLFTLGSQDQFGFCEKSHKQAGGDVPDWLLAELPRGVEAGWGRNVWTRDSFSCRASAL